MAELVAALLRGQDRRRRAGSDPGSTVSATTLRPCDSAPAEARAIVLADKLHNLISIELDLRTGVRSGASSTPSAIRCSGTTDAMLRRVPATSAIRGLQQLAARCREVLARIEALAC